MPSPNRIKEYWSDSYYHLFNRGIKRQTIFKNRQDYERMIFYLKLSLTPPENLQEEIKNLKRIENSTAMERSFNNAILQGAKYQLYKQIDLVSFCLMPNHFHFLVYQRQKRSIELFMRRVASGYSSYFTFKYQESGSLFENRYKAGHLHYNPKLQLLFTARYIERNPYEAGIIKDMQQQYPYSSLQFYKKRSKPIWLNTQKLERAFSRIKERPNSFIEEKISQSGNYLDFVQTETNIEMEDIRLQGFR